MRYRLATLFVFFFLLFFSGCQRIIPPQKIKEGIASFNIKYETSKEENPIVVLLPKKMKTFFKHNNTATVVEGFFSSFKMILLTRCDIDRKYAIVRVLDKKYIYETDLDGKPFGIDQMKPMKITLIDSSFTYKGLKCKIARIYCPAISQKPYDVYYTEDIDIKNANINSPYYKIPGVLVKFKLKLFNVIMDVELNDIQKQAVDNSIFEIPKNNYKYVSLDELEKIINQFQ